MHTLKNKNKRIFATQFHPEVVHTQMGKEILGNFLFKIAGCHKSWSPKSDVVFCFELGVVVIVFDLAQKWIICVHRKELFVHARHR